MANKENKLVNSEKRDLYVAEKKKSKKKKKNGVNIFKKISKYFNGVILEINRIRWTNKKDLFKYSVATLLFVLFFGLYFYAIDWVVLLIRSLTK